MRFATSLAAIALLGTITFAQSITYDFDSTANFASFRTYAWITGTNVPDALNHQRIVSAISAQLGARGLTRIDRQARPDVYVAYHASFDRDRRSPALAPAGAATGCRAVVQPAPGRKRF